jgi:hypothetical protein
MEASVSNSTKHQQCGKSSVQPRQQAKHKRRLPIKRKGKRKRTSEDPKS